MQSGPGAAGLFTCCPGNGNLMALQLLTAAAVGSGLFRYLELGLVCTGEDRLLDAVVVVFRPARNMSMIYCSLCGQAQEQQLLPRPRPCPMPCPGIAQAIRDVR